MGGIVELRDSEVLVDVNSVFHPLNASPDDIYQSRPVEKQSNQEQETYNRQTNQEQVYKKHGHVVEDGMEFLHNQNSNNLE